jgi:hypothetical protein
MSEYIMQVDYDTFHGTFSHKKREEIVRCRDCRHIVWTDNPMTRTHYWCIENDRPNALDDFCSLAERREDGGIESIYDWEWVREMVGEEEAERRKEQQREEESE